MRNAVTSRAALAKLPVLRKSDIAALQKENPPFGGLNVTRARQGAPAADVAGADLRAGRRTARTGTAPRARCSPPASAPATSCTIPSPIISRPAASSWSRAAQALGCAVIPGGVGNTEQQLEAIAHYQAVRLYRHAGFPEDPARRRRQDRQGRFLDQARAGVGRGAAGLAARGTGQARRRRAAMLRHRRTGRDRL